MKFPCGHERTKANTYSYANKDGSTRHMCRECRNERWRSHLDSLRTFRKPERQKTPKYHGQKAGKIVIGRGAKWGAGLV